MKSRTWHQCRIRIPASHQDLLVGQLAAAGFSGFSQEDDVLAAVIASGDWTAAKNQELQRILDAFAIEFPGLALGFETSILKEQNWNKTWEQRTGIVEATDRIIIKPSWKKLRKKDAGKIVLHIDPKMSFGTGHHETTRLMLRLLQKYVRKGQRVLDFGSGTGVLAIAAAKLGADAVVAIDNDPWCTENAGENVRRNRASRKVTVLEGSASSIPSGKFDLIVANIDFPTIHRFGEKLSQKLSRRSVVLFSGLLTTDLESIAPLFSSLALTTVETIHENEWSAVVLLKT